MLAWHIASTAAAAAAITTSFTIIGKYQKIKMGQGCKQVISKYY